MGTGTQSTAPAGDEPTERIEGKRRVREYIALTWRNNLVKTAIIAVTQAVLYELVRNPAGT